MFNLVYQSIQSLKNPSLWRLLAGCVLTNLILLILFIWGVMAGMEHLAQHAGSIPLWLVQLLTGATAIIAAWFLFPILLPMIAGLFAQNIADIIEKSCYPQSMLLTPPPSFWQSFCFDIRLAITGILLNIIVLPLYLLPGINIIPYYLLNGYLLGHGFFMIIARRHLPIPEIRALRRQYRWKLLIAGMVIVALSAVPGINLLVPILAVAMMVHLFQRIENSNTQPKPFR